MMTDGDAVKEASVPPGSFSLTSTMTITPLGAGNEVGRSCIMLSFKGKNIMLDCGIHPAYSGLAALPFFDEVDPASIDMILITHFHLDHVASLPYFTEKTNFKGKIFMTHPTKAIYKWLLMDFVKVSNISPDDQLYDEKDLLRSYDKITAVDYHQEVDVDGVKFTCYNAGHVLGAAMFFIDIGGIQILYTGDYSREADRHLLPAELPPGRMPHVMICESTYGVQSHEPRLERERRFTSAVHEIVGRGGRCLLPVFALGKAQELLLILDEYWTSHPELRSVPIYYASSLAKKCLAIYQTYLNMMNPVIRQQMLGHTSSSASDTLQGGDTVGRAGSAGKLKSSNPFVFKHISNIRSMEGFDDIGPCVMMASPGMLQNGLSRELFEAWCADKRNGIVISGYSVEGTLAKHILNGPSEVPAMSGAKLPLNMSVDYVSFSAHVDFIQNSEFIDTIHPQHLILVHGEVNEMMRLRSALQHRYEEETEGRHDDADDAVRRRMSIYTPRNCERVELCFREEIVAKTLGSLAVKTKPSAAAGNLDASGSTIVDGILVRRSFHYQMMAPSDLPLYTTLSTTSLKQVAYVYCAAPFSLIEHHVRQFIGTTHVARTTLRPTRRSEEKASVKMNEDDLLMLTILNHMTLRQGGLEEDPTPLSCRDKKLLVLEWMASPMNDLLIDSIMTLILTAESSPASVKLSRQEDHAHNHGHASHAEIAKNVYGQSRQPPSTAVLKKTSEGEDVFELLLRNYFDVVSCDVDPVTGLALYHVEVDHEVYTLIPAQLEVHGKNERMIRHLKDIMALHQMASKDDIFVPSHH